MGKTTEIDQIIALNLKRLVGDKYGVQKKLAQKADITAQTLNRIMLGRQHAGPAVVRDLARAIGVSEVDLYQRHEPDAPIYKMRGSTMADAVRILAAFEKAELHTRDAVLRLLGLEASESSDEIISRVVQTQAPKPPQDSSNDS